MEWPAMLKAKYEPIMRAKYCDIGWLGHGWRPIVEGLLDELLKYEGQINIGQIKEKFGGLRVYIDMMEDAVDGDAWDHPAYGLIGAAENRCFEVCEECGGVDDVLVEPAEGHYWVKTMCSVCRGNYDEVLKAKWAEAGA